MSTAPSASWQSVFALAMVSQACLFWWANSTYFSLGDMPDTVSGLWRKGDFSAGSVSHRGRSSAFISFVDYAPEFGFQTQWTEHNDGHFCNFIVPPYGWQPPGLRLFIDWGTLCWTCPYWLIVSAWVIAFAKTRKAFRFNLRDALAIVGLTAISLGLMQMRVALLATTILNIATAALLAWFVVRSIARALLATTPAESPRPAEV